MLDRIRRPIAHYLGELPAVLAFDRAEQAPEVGLSMPARFAARKAWGEPLGHHGHLLRGGGESRDQLRLRSRYRGRRRGRDGGGGRTRGRWGAPRPTGREPFASPPTHLQQL